MVFDVKHVCHRLWLGSNRDDASKAPYLTRHVHDLIALEFHDLSAAPTLFSLLQDRDFAERVVAHERDIFLALAAAGGLTQLNEISSILRPLFPLGIDMDTELMIEVASRHGHSEVASWLEKSDIFKQTTKPTTVDAGFKPLPAWDQSETSTRTLQDTTDRLRHLHLSTSQDVVANLCFKVLTYRPLMTRIGRFQESPRQILERVTFAMEREGHLLYRNGSPLGRYVHTAILHGDMGKMKELYLLSRSRNRWRELSFVLAMHLAAGEGQLEILKWLHKNGASKCRPDTMAMAVRCGHAQVVEWLHWTCPESALTMSEFAVNEAVRCGHKDVVQVCVQYGLPGLSSSTLETAIEMNDMVTLTTIAGARRDLVTESMIDSAIQTGRADALRVLHASDSFEINAERLASALTAAHEEVVDVFLSFVELSSTVVHQCALEFFHVVWGKGARKGVKLLLPSVVESYTTGDPTSMQEETVKILTMLQSRWHTTQCSVEIAQVKLGDDDHAIDIDGLAELFCRVACDATQKEVLKDFVDHKLDLLCDSAFSLVAQHDLEALQLMNHRRTKDDAVEALREATDETVVRFLLSHEDKFYTRRVMMENAPRCLAAAIVRFSIANVGHLGMDDVIDWKAATEFSNGYLSPREVSRAIDLGMEGILLRHCEVMIHVHLWIDALVYNDYLRVLAFLYHEAKMTDTGSYQQEALVIALRSGLRKVFFDRMPYTPIEESEISALVGILERQSDAILEQVYSSLIQILRGHRWYYTTTVDVVKAAQHLGHPLIKWLSRLPKSHRQNILLTAAEEGEADVVRSVLQNPSDDARAQTDLVVLRAMVYAVRQGHHGVVLLLHERKGDEEALDVATIRACYGWKEPVAAQTLLSLLESVDESIRAVLTSERLACCALFGMASTSQSVIEKPRTTSCRRPRGRRGRAAGGVDPDLPTASHQGQVAKRSSVRQSSREVQWSYRTTNKRNWRWISSY